MAAKAAGRMPFLDTNVLLRHLLHDVPGQSERASTYIGEIALGSRKARIADTVILEAVFVLQRTYKVPKQEIADALLSLIDLPGIVLPRKRLFRTAFDYYASLNISFGDAYHAALMQSLHIDEVISFDRDFDRLADITRLEP
ncbi:MAG: PIN domain-containing protein [Chloroflexota bacterium]